MFKKLSLHKYYNWLNGKRMKFVRSIINEHTGAIQVQEKGKTVATQGSQRCHTCFDKHRGVSKRAAHSVGANSFLLWFKTEQVTKILWKQKAILVDFKNMIF